VSILCFSERVNCPIPGAGYVFTMELDRDQERPATTWQTSSFRNSFDGESHP